MSDRTTRRRHRAAQNAETAAAEAPRKRARVKESRSWQGTIWEWAKAILWALAVALLIRQFLFQAFRIPTGSMKNSLLVHDYLFVNKMIYGAKTPDRLVIPFLNKTLIDDIPHVRLPGFRQPEQGDIIVFEFPEDRNQDYIKRCVAVAGDTVEVRDGVLLVNDEIYESNFSDRDGDHSCVPNWRDRDECPEPRTLHDPVSLGKGAFNRTFGPIAVPAEHIFMMGDNRYNSWDSRYWGPVSLDLVRGKAEIIYWSYDKTFFIPRVGRLLKLVDLPPGRGWLQPTVRVVVLLLIAYGFYHYRRRDRRQETGAD